MTVEESRDLFPSVISVGNVNTYIRNDGNNLIFKDVRSGSEVNLVTLNTKTIGLQNNGVTVGHPIILNFSGFAITVAPAGTVATITPSPFSGNVSQTTQGYLNNSNASAPVLIRDNDGLTIANGANSQSVNLNITDANTLTATGIFAVPQINVGTIASSGNIVAELGDGAGVDSFLLTNNSATIVASIDSLGGASFSNITDTSLAPTQIAFSGPVGLLQGTNGFTFTPTGYLSTNYYGVNIEGNFNERAYLTVVNSNQNLSGLIAGDNLYPNCIELNYRGSNGVSSGWPDTGILSLNDQGSLFTWSGATNGMALATMAGPMLFSTNGTTERFRLDPSGGVLFTLGDHAGSNSVTVNDSNTNSIFNIDSTGIIKVYNNVNFQETQAIAFRVENIATPSAGNPGRLIYDSGALKYDNGSSFLTVQTSSGFSGDVSTTTQGYLNNSLTNQPVLIRDNDGLTIANNANSQSVNLNITDANTLTMSGTLIGTAFTAPVVNVDTINPDTAGFVTMSTVVVGQTPTLATHLTTKAYVDAAATAAVFSGDMHATTQGYLTDSSNGPITVRANNGFKIANTGDTISATFVPGGDGPNSVELVGSFTIDDNAFIGGPLNVDNIVPNNTSELSLSAPAGQIIETCRDGVSVLSDQGISVNNSDGRLGAILRSLYVTTTSAVPTSMTLNDEGDAFPAIATDSTHGFSGMIIARGISGTNLNNVACWKFSVLIADIDGTASVINWTEEVVGSQFPAWDIDMVIDNTNHQLDLQVTGDAGSTIIWSGWIIEAII